MHITATTGFMVDESLAQQIDDEEAGFASR
jgi:hypothetical protein